MPDQFCIVTPSYNQAPYVEATLQSVLSQGAPGLEYIVLDGGSTDGSAEIIRRYGDRLTYWESAPDKGQSDAIHRGFQRGRGNIMAWLNSDDTYEPGALARVARAFAENPNAVCVYGDYYVLYPDGSKVLKPKVSFDFNIALYAYLMIPQASAFWRREVYEEVGGLNLDLHYSMDWDLFLRIGRRYPDRFVHIPEPLSTFRVHADSKSVSKREAFRKENRFVRGQFTGDPRWRRKLKEKFHLARVEWKYLTERGTLILKKDRTKA
jgi:glycosyltransferase involved in cell wall biosynthesis